MWGCYGVIEDSKIAIYLPRHNVDDAECRVDDMKRSIETIDDDMLFESDNVLDTKISDLDINDMGIISNMINHIDTIMSTSYLYNFLALISLSVLDDHEITYISEDDLDQTLYKIIL